MQPKYQHQGSLHRRTEEAILEGTKSLIARVGIARLSMIEIADHSQVSRATLYNHFRDKDAVLAALLTSEVSRICSEATNAGTPADALEALSIAISSDQALEAIRRFDGEILSGALAHTQSELFIEPEDIEIHLAFVGRRCWRNQTISCNRFALLSVWFVRLFYRQIGRQSCSQLLSHCLA